MASSWLGKHPASSENRLLHVIREAWGWFVRAYLVRVPLVSGAFLLAMPVLAFYPVSARRLFQNLLVMSAWSFFWTMLAAYLASWTVLVTYRVIILNRQERFGISSPRADKLSPLSQWVALILPVPLLIAVLLLRTEAEPSHAVPVYLMAAAAGLAAAYGLAFAAVALATKLVPPRRLRANHFLPVFFAWQKRLVYAPDGAAAELGAEPKLILSGPQAGYLDPRDAGAAYLRLYDGHWLASISFLLSFAVYLSLGYAENPDVPAICYVLQLQFMATWLLAGAAFFLDRYRIPLAVPIGAACLASVLLAPVQYVKYRFPFLPVPSSDHYYSIERRAVPPLPSPAEILNAFSNKTGGKIVVVATAGGGIQAAAWTARVLTGLENSLSGANQRFSESLALLSGVSGGAVGMMYFVNAYDESAGRLFSGQAQNVIGQAEAPSLNQVAWGLTNPDVTRIVFPFFRITQSAKLDDRGNALERSWSARAKLNAWLSDWIAGAARARRPAVLFNSTIAETGEPFLLATTHFQDQAGAPNFFGKVPHRKFFYTEHQGYDIKAVTAARLAATFPFVTPAARPLQTGGPAYHEIDGGYYDNYGLASLMAWLGQALRNRAAGAPPNILVIRIQSFPTDPVPDAGPRTWFFQLLAPFEGLMSVRGAGQLLRDDEELRVFEKRWEGEGVKFWNAQFQFMAKDAPLSWQMNRGQKQAIEEQWDAALRGNCWKVVQGFLAGGNSGARHTCLDNR